MKYLIAGWCIELSLNARLVSANNIIHAQVCLMHCLVLAFPCIKPTTVNKAISIMHSQQCSIRSV